jgi:hypothetical protein
VLTAGTTGTGAIDALGAIPNAGWVYVDAAAIGWAEGFATGAHEFAIPDSQVNV